jgi:hypothetical protein
MAVWALSRLLDGRRFRALRAQRQETERDPDVRREWDAAPPPARRLAG